MDKIGAWFSNLWRKVAQDYFSGFDVNAWAVYARHLIDSVLILVICWLLILLARFIIRRINQRVGHIHGSTYRRRIETITSLIASTIRYVIYLGGLFAVLGEWGVNTQSLLVGTAVVGAAVGFGSQGLVQDVITGLSILAEEQLSVGDYVEISGKSGAVEEVGLRVVKIRDSAGVQHVIFNRTIAMVSNFTSRALQGILDVSLENEDAGKKAVPVAERVCTDIAQELPYFPKAPIVEGVRKSTTGDVFMRIKVWVLPGQDAAITSHLAERIKSAFAIEGIKIPNDKVRVAILSDLFKQAIARGEESKRNAAVAK